MINSKLPKQWNRWVKNAGLKLSYPNSEPRYLEGHGRYFRVDCVNHLDMSEPFETFDRWANSCEASVSLDDVNNETDFIRVVAGLLLGQHDDFEA